MRKAVLSSRFSRNRGSLAGKSQGLYDPTPNTNDSTKKTKKKTCSTVSQAPNLVQRQSPTSKAASPPDNSINTTDQACSRSVIRNKTTVRKTESSQGHGNTHYMPSRDKRQDTTPHSTQQNDEGHIHRALPIRGLPPESVNNDITRASQHNSDGKSRSLRQRSYKQLKCKDKQQNQQRTTETNHGNGDWLPQEVEYSFITTQPTDHWGNELSPKPSNTICLLLQNVGGIDLNP